MRGPLSTGRILPTIAVTHGTTHHRCIDCHVDLCADLRVLGFTDQLQHLLHEGQGKFYVLPHRGSRCFRCEKDYRSRY